MRGERPRGAAMEPLRRLLLSLAALLLLPPRLAVSPGPLGWGRAGAAGARGGPREGSWGDPAGVSEGLPAAGGVLGTHTPPALLSLMPCVPLCTGGGCSPPAGYLRLCPPAV